HRRRHHQLQGDVITRGHAAFHGQLDQCAAGVDFVAGHVRANHRAVLDVGLDGVPQGFNRLREKEHGIAVAAFHRWLTPSDSKVAIIAGRPRMPATSLTDRYHLDINNVGSPNHGPPENAMKENPIRSLPGIPMLLLLLVVALACGWLFFQALVNGGAVLQLVAAIAIGGIALFCLAGLYMVEPNQSAVLSLFGKYVGTVHENGLRWNNPFLTKRKDSLRIRNFESGKLKVNELEGSPTEIAAVIVWQVVDSAEAVFNVDDYESFVHIQSEAALRAMATTHPYDQHEDGQMSLRSHPVEISNELKQHLDERLGSAGVEVLEARISHLAYAPEI